MVFFRAFLHVLEQNDYGGKNSRLVTTEEMKGKSQKNRTDEEDFHVPDAQVTEENKVFNLLVQRETVIV